jgi:hypothetical protein
MVRLLFLFSWVASSCVCIRYIMLAFRQRNVLYFVHLSRNISTLEGHHQMLQLICLQLLICNLTIVLHTIFFIELNIN